MCEWCALANVYTPKPAHAGMARKLTARHLFISAGGNE